MDRKKFLSTLDFGAASTDVDPTSDLNDPAYSTLEINGNHIYIGGVIVARTLNGEYDAVSSACTRSLAQHHKLLTDNPPGVFL